MLKTFARACGLAAALLTALPALAQPPRRAAEAPFDLVIWGGPIHTADDARPTAQAVGVSGGRIAFVGERAAARRRVTARTQVVDLRGASLYPGFTDSHAHLSGIGEREVTLNLEGTASLAALVEAVRGRVAASRPGELIVGRGWIETRWPERRFPTRADLDAVAPNHPVLLTRADGHALVANSAALTRAGVTERTAAPSGGEILKDAAGRPTGMLIDDAMGLVASLRTAPSREQRLEHLRRGMAVETAYGWTGVHNMSVHWDEVELMEAMAREARAPLRVYNAVDAAFAPQLFASGPRATPDGRIVTRTIKVYADGALGSRGALLLAPYADAPGSRGLTRLSEAQALPLYREALRRGIQIATHAIGDAANRQVLDLYEEVLRGQAYNADRLTFQRRVANRPASPRWRIEHAQVLSPQEIPSFARLGVIASMQPSHAIGDLHFAPARLGQERLAGAYAWRALLDANARVVFGSDAPVERGDPLIEFYAAVARRDLRGFSGPGWHPEQAVDRQAALRAFTLWPAYARFAENELGSITVGKRADLTAFSVDLMSAPVTEIPRGRALLTVVDGRVVHRARGW